MIAVATLGVKAVLEVGRSLLHSVPRGLDRWRFGRFFGPGAASGDSIIIVVGPYQHPLPQEGNRYVKRFLGRRPDGQLTGESDVLGVNSVRAVAHVSALFATHQHGGHSIPIVTDESVAQRWDATFVSIGGSDSNLRTLDIESLPQQSFYQWSADVGGLPCITAGHRTFSNAGNIEFGLILRLRNPHSPKHWLFVCAGLGPWATSGAAWFLAQHWRTLGKRHAAAVFLKIVAVQRGSDESAREEYSVGRSGTV